MKKKYTKAEEFIRVVNSSETFDQVAERLGVRKNTIKQRVRAYARQGIALRALADTPRGLDIEALKVVSAETLPDGVETVRPPEE